MHGQGFMADTSMKFDGRYVPLGANPFAYARWADSGTSPRLRPTIRTERLHGRMNEVGITMRDAARRAFGPLGEAALPAGTVNSEDPFWKS
jgi:hypothetical protein